MPDRVIWNLTYPVNTPDDRAIFRHHFETLRLDSNVASVEASENTMRGVMVMRVEFGEGRDRPDSVELRHADARFPTTANIERNIQVSHQANPYPSFTPPTITGMTSDEVIARMREVADALRTPDLAFARGPVVDVSDIRARGTPIKTTTEIPKWVVIGREYESKRFGVVTLKGVSVSPTYGVMLECTQDDGREISVPLSENLREFTPFKRPKRLTAWERVLDDGEED